MMHHAACCPRGLWAVFFEGEETAKGKLFSHIKLLGEDFRDYILPVRGIVLTLQMNNNNGQE
ncbi:MAG: hypothetical protein KBT39_08945 [Bacteroidales bacterium]|nr:hypothetical protein [Bacteroidales bacterium]